MRRLWRWLTGQRNGETAGIRELHPGRGGAAGAAEAETPAIRRAARDLAGLPLWRWLNGCAAR